MPATRLPATTLSAPSLPALITDVEAYCRSVAERAKLASAQVARLSGQSKNDWLRLSAQLLRRDAEAILAANRLDVESAQATGLSSAMVDRLTLTPRRIEDLSQALESIAALPDPLGEVLDSCRRPNGLEVSKIRVPLGVVFFVYESRPNVTADAAAICLKSGNAVILRGGKEAAQSSRAIVERLRAAAEEAGVPTDALQLVETADREAVSHFLKLAEFIDVAIPRGGETLIRRVAADARMPVIKHYTGNCHLYVDRLADLEMAVKLIVNSKCQRPGVCNACETLLVHRDVASTFLPQAGAALMQQGVELRADERSRQLVPAAQPATEADYSTEFLALILAVKIVDSLDEAIAHINRYGSHHTDAIVTSDLNAAREFVAAVDSAAVMVNASTRFNDGAEFGLGAEIGISTDKFHARGPCGLKELTSYKYVCYGTGQVRQ